MLRLIKNLTKVMFLFIKDYYRKGKILLLILPLITAAAFTGGILFNRSCFSQEKEVPVLSELEMFDRELVESYTGISFNYQPSISTDGRYITFSAIKVEIDRIKDVEIKLYDKENRKYIELPGINGKGWDLAPSISGDGRWIAFQSNRNGATKWDIFLYDVKTKKMTDLPNLNSIFPDFNPSISPDARFITFNSVRSLIPKVYLYDLNGKKITPLIEEE